MSALCLVNHFAAPELPAAVFDGPAQPRILRSQPLVWSACVGSLSRSALHWNRGHPILTAPDGRYWHKREVPVPPAKVGVIGVKQT
jgi:hypothetical protein